MKTFKGILLVVIFFLSINISNIAQTENKTETKNLHSFSVYFINGYALGYDYYKTDAFKLRATLDLSLSGENQDSDDKRTSHYFSSSYSNNSIQTTVTETDRNDFSLTLSSQIILPIYKTEYGNIYFGSGPGIGYSRNFSSSIIENTVYDPDTILSSNSHAQNDYTTTDYRVMLNVLIGAEVYISNNLSLFAETHLNAGLSWSEQKTLYKYLGNLGSEQNSEVNQNGNGWFYNFQYARIGVKISL